MRCERRSFGAFPLTIFQLDSLQGDLILAMTYGYEVRGLDDRKVTVARKMTEHGSTNALPGALLVNELPFRVFSFFGYTHCCSRFTTTLLVRHIPEWLPWFSYKPLARIGVDLGNEVLNEPIRFVVDGMVN